MPSHLARRLDQARARSSWAMDGGDHPSPPPPQWWFRTLPPPSPPNTRPSPPPAPPVPALASKLVSPIGMGVCVFSIAVFVLARAVWGARRRREERVLEEGRRVATATQDELQTKSLAERIHALPETVYALPETLAGEGEEEEGAGDESGGMLIARPGIPGPPQDTRAAAYGARGVAVGTGEMALVFNVGARCASQTTRQAIRCACCRAATATTASASIGARRSPHRTRGGPPDV